MRPATAEANTSKAIKFTGSSVKGKDIVIMPGSSSQSTRNGLYQQSSTNSSYLKQNINVGNKKTTASSNIMGSTKSSQQAQFKFKQENRSPPKFFLAQHQSKQINATKNTQDDTSEGHLSSVHSMRC